MAFLRGDSQTMQQQLRWFANDATVASFGLHLAADTAAYSGQAKQARELSEQSVAAAKRVGDKEDAAIALGVAASRDAGFGDVAHADAEAEASLRLAPRSEAVMEEAGLAYSMTGDVGPAQSLSTELNARFPLNTQVQSLWLPAIHAELELSRGNPSEACSMDCPFMLNQAAVWHDRQHLADDALCDGLSSRGNNRRSCPG